ncbi:hypothetical protein Q5P01_001697 [Channa striata]|uniref:Uncharacterized protein n=1 Tax=Channa striata TaxID=64152 RepID=A0AA88NT05_CHASR|nr:hypothetical protein Q5P01_001697 [Channa striata]
MPSIITDDDLATALCNSRSKEAGEDVQYAAPHCPDPAHVDEKELHTRHDQPGDIRGSGHNMALYKNQKAFQNTTTEGLW